MFHSPHLQHWRATCGSGFEESIFIVVEGRLTAEFECLTMQEKYFVERSRKRVYFLEKGETQEYIGYASDE